MLCAHGFQRAEVSLERLLVLGVVVELDGSGERAVGGEERRSGDALLEEACGFVSRSLRGASEVRWAMHGRTVEVGIPEAIAGVWSEAGVRAAGQEVLQALGSAAHAPPTRPAAWMPTCVSLVLLVHGGTTELPMGGAARSRALATSPIWSAWKMEHGAAEDAVMLPMLAFVGGSNGILDHSPIPVHSPLNRLFRAIASTATVTNKEPELTPLHSPTSTSPQTFQRRASDLPLVVPPPPTSSSSSPPPPTSSPSSPVAVAPPPLASGDAEGRYGESGGGGGEGGIEGEGGEVGIGGVVEMGVGVSLLSQDVWRYGVLGDSGREMVRGILLSVGLPRDVHSLPPHGDPGAKGCVLASREGGGAGGGREVGVGRGKGKLKGWWDGEREGGGGEWHLAWGIVCDMLSVRGGGGGGGGGGEEFWVRSLLPLFDGQVGCKGCEKERKLMALRWENVTQSRGKVLEAPDLSTPRIVWMHRDGLFVCEGRDVARSTLSIALVDAGMPLVRDVSSSGPKAVWKSIPIIPHSPPSSRFRAVVSDELVEVSASGGEREGRGELREPHIPTPLGHSQWREFEKWEPSLTLRKDNGDIISISGRKSTIIGASGIPTEWHSGTWLIQTKDTLSPPHPLSSPPPPHPTPAPPPASSFPASCGPPLLYIPSHLPPPPPTSKVVWCNLWRGQEVGRGEEEGGEAVEQSLTSSRFPRSVPFPTPPHDASEAHSMALSRLLFRTSENAALLLEGPHLASSGLAPAFSAAGAHLEPVRGMASMWAGVRWAKGCRKPKREDFVVTHVLKERSADPKVHTLDLPHPWLPPKAQGGAAFLPHVILDAPHRGFHVEIVGKRASITFDGDDEPTHCNGEWIWVGPPHRVPPPIHLPHTAGTAPHYSSQPRSTASSQQQADADDCCTIA